MRLDNKETVFNVYKAIHFPHHYEDLHMISIVEVDESVLGSIVCLENSIDKLLMLFDNIEFDVEVEELMHIQNASYEYIKYEPQFEPLDRLSGPPPKPCIEEAPTLDLKPLPSSSLCIVWHL